MITKAVDVSKKMKNENSLEDTLDYVFLVSGKKKINQIIKVSFPVGWFSVDSKSVIPKERIRTYL